MTKTTLRTSALIMGLLTGFAGITPAVAGDLTPTESERMLAPLPRTDPRAQVDPVLVGLPEAPVPAATGKKMSKRRAQRAEGFDVATGKGRRGRSPKAGAGGEHFVAEAMGAAAQDEAAPVEMTPSPFDPNVIWGADDRVRITPTTSYPWRAQVKLFSTFPNGARYGCSGTLISPKYILTAGHCVFGRADGGWASRIEAVPGYDNGYRPYGSAYGTYFRSVTGWTSSSNPDYDFALITLDRAIGNTVGWLGYGNFSDSTLWSAAANLSGYPGDKCGAACQYYDSDPFRLLFPNTIHYQTDTYAGQSGSGVYIFYNGGRYVAAAHRGTCGASGTTNCGVRINSGRFTQIQGWINSGY